MKSQATGRFRKLLDASPHDVQRAARRAFRAWQQNPSHPSLEFKRLRDTQEPVYSARVGLHWRALALQDGDVYVWFWIGSHSEYDTLIAQL
jgi:hypothetical protein